jgi:hypothetical protein
VHRVARGKFQPATDIHKYFVNRNAALEISKLLVGGLFLNNYEVSKMPKTETVKQEIFDQLKLIQQDYYNQEHVTTQPGPGGTSPGNGLVSKIY